MTYKRPYLRSPKNYDKSAPDNHYVGQDYWTTRRYDLDTANAEFAKRMRGRKFEDDRRAR